MEAGVEAALGRIAECDKTDARLRDVLKEFQFFLSNPTEAAYINLAAKCDPTAREKFEPAVAYYNADALENESVIRKRAKSYKRELEVESEKRVKQAEREKIIRRMPPSSAMEVEPGAGSKTSGTAKKRKRGEDAAAN